MRSGCSRRIAITRHVTWHAVTADIPAHQTSMLTVTVGKAGVTAMTIEPVKPAK